MLPSCFPSVISHTKNDIIRLSIVQNLPLNAKLGAYFFVTICYLGRNLQHTEANFFFTRWLHRLCINAHYKREYKVEYEVAIIVINPPELHAS